MTQDTIHETVCVPGYTAKVRNVPQAEKKAVLKAYRQAHPRWPTCAQGACEYDHLISLELGGSNDASNLWPEPYPGAKEKDKVENALHRQVCSGQITLKVAQDLITKDWRSALSQK